MILKLDRPESFPGGQPATRKREMSATLTALGAAVLWPPLVLTLPFWRPAERANWMPGLEMDWRLMLLVVGLIAAPLGLRLIDRERARGKGPTTRLGIVWRFMFFGGVFGAGLQAVIAVIASVTGLFLSESFAGAVGAMVTTLLIFGVGGIVTAALVGVSYGLWAGLCVAMLAFSSQPQVRGRMGVMGDRSS